MPIQPTVVRSLGATVPEPPRADEGMMVGRAIAAVATPAVLFMN
jgi:hypothetical protein